jgi:hypothetical protein
LDGERELIAQKWVADRKNHRQVKKKDEMPNRQFQTKRLLPANWWFPAFIQIILRQFNNRYLKRSWFSPWMNSMTANQRLRPIENEQLNRWVRCKKRKDLVSSKT